MPTPRLLLILTEFPPRIGGMQTHAHYLSRALAARGYPVEVVTYQVGPRDDHASIRQIDAALPFPVHRVLSRLGYFHNFDVIERLARDFRPDLVYCSTVFYGALGERLGVPVVSRSVGNDVLRPWIAYPFRPFSRLVSHPRIEDPLHRLFRNMEHPELIEAIWRARRVALMRSAARQQTRILANSAFTARLHEEIGVDPSRVQVLVGGVEADRFTPDPTAGGDPHAQRDALEIPRERFLLMTACRMVRKKGVDFLLESMAELVRRTPDLHLVLVGDGRHYKRFRRAAARSEAADHITFTGRVAHDQIHPLYATADAFVLASRVQEDPITGVRDAETMGRVLCEANAAHVPVLAARSGGIPSVIAHEENGLLFEPDDVESLHQTIMRLRAQPALASALVARGARLATERFDWSVIADAHERCFLELLGHETPAPGTGAANAPQAHTKTDSRAS